MAESPPGRKISFNPTPKWKVSLVENFPIENFLLMIIPLRAISRVENPPAWNTSENSKSSENF